MGWPLGRVLVLVSGLAVTAVIRPASSVAVGEAFSFVGIGLGSDLAEVIRRYPRSQVVGGHIYVAPEEVRDHVHGIGIAGTGPLRRVRIDFERPRANGGPRYPECVHVQAEIEARYGPPARIRAFAEERMRHSDRVWARGGESLTLVCFFDTGGRLLAEAIVIVPGEPDP